MVFPTILFILFFYYFCYEIDSVSLLFQPSINFRTFCVQSLFFLNTPLANHAFLLIILKPWVANLPFHRKVPRPCLLVFPHITGSLQGFFIFSTLETPEVYISTFWPRSVHSIFKPTRRTCIDQSVGKVWENNSLATSSSVWQTEDYYFNGKFYLKTLKPKKTQWMYLLYISNSFFIDESSWDPCSLWVNMSVLLMSGP